MTRSTTYLDHPADHRTLAEWCECRKTSIPFGRAIHEVSRRRGLDPDTVWEDGAPPAVMAEIDARAWELAEPDCDEMNWGEEACSRPLARHVAQLATPTE